METQECLKTKEDCIERGYKIFNSGCYNECPSNSKNKNNDNICFCSYNFFSNNNLINCFNEKDNCTSKGYAYTNIETKECFNIKEECIEKGYKIFNKACYDKCPLNSEDKNNNSICECSYYYYNNNGILKCLGKYEKCEKERYIKNKDNKECIKEINNLNNINCPNDHPFYNIQNESCIEICSALDFFNNICKINNNNIENKDKIIKMLQNDLYNGNMNEIFVFINEEKTELIVEDDNSLYIITTSENEKNNTNNNLSTILLGECEIKLREYYNMSDNEPLFIFKIENYEEGLLIPIIEYEVYNLNEKGKLDLDICKDIKIDILLPVSINEDNLFKHNSSHDYYNDICYPYTTENGTDIILEDRRNE